MSGDLELEVGVRRGDVLLAPRSGFLRDIGPAYVPRIQIAGDATPSASRSRRRAPLRPAATPQVDQDTRAIQHRLAVGAADELSQKGLEAAPRRSHLS